MIDKNNLLAKLRSTKQEPPKEKPVEPEPPKAPQPKIEQPKINIDDIPIKKTNPIGCTFYCNYHHVFMCCAACKDTKCEDRCKDDEKTCKYKEQFNLNKTIIRRN